MFLLGVEEGAFVGCDENFSKSLGAPVGPAVEKMIPLRDILNQRHMGSFQQ